MYVQSDTLLLPDVFEIHELDPAHFLSEPGLEWKSCLRKKGVKLELITGVDMLLMVEKGIEVEYVMKYIGMQEQIISI